MNSNPNMHGIKRFREQSQDPLARFPPPYLKAQLVQMLAGMRWGILKPEEGAEVEGIPVDLFFPSILTAIIIRPIGQSKVEESKQMCVSWKIEEAGYKIILVHAKQILLNKEELRTELFYRFLAQVKLHNPAEYQTYINYRKRLRADVESGNRKKAEQKKKLKDIHYKIDIARSL